MMRWHGSIAGKEHDGFTYGCPVFLYDPQTQEPRFIGWFCGYNEREGSYLVELKNTVGVFVAYNRLSILTAQEAQTVRSQNGTFAKAASWS